MKVLIFLILLVLGIFIMGISLLGFVAVIFNLIVPLTFIDVLKVFGFGCVLLGSAIGYMIVSMQLWDRPKK